MFAMVACLLGSNALLDGTVNSLMRNRPQNARVNAALSMCLSYWFRRLEEFSDVISVRKTSKVIGRLCLVILLFFAWILLAPFRTSLRIGFRLVGVLKPFQCPEAFPIVPSTYCSHVHFDSCRWQTRLQLYDLSARQNGCLSCHHVLDDMVRMRTRSWRAIMPHAFINHCLS